MRDTSLEEVLNEIIKLISKLNIPHDDKVELMINIMHFLDKKEYKNNINKLRK